MLGVNPALSLNKSCQPYRLNRPKLELSSCLFPPDTMVQATISTHCFPSSLLPPFLPCLLNVYSPHTALAFDSINLSIPLSTQIFLWLHLTPPGPPSVTWPLRSSGPSSPLSFPPSIPATQAPFCGSNSPGAFPPQGLSTDSPLPGTSSPGIPGLTL